MLKYFPPWYPSPPFFRSLHSQAIKSYYGHGSLTVNSTGNCLYVISVSSSITLLQRHPTTTPWLIYEPNKIGVMPTECVIYDNKLVFHSNLKREVLLCVLPHRLSLLHRALIQFRWPPLPADIKAEQQCPPISCSCHLHRTARWIKGTTVNRQGSIDSQSITKPLRTLYFLCLRMELQFHWAPSWLGLL